MPLKVRQIWVEEKDLLRLRNEVKAMAIKEKPELEGLVLSDRYLFKRILDDVLK